MSIRKISALTLKQLHVKNPAVVEGFIKALQDEEAFVRQEAANGLGSLKRYAVNAVPHLAAVALRDKSEAVQHAAWQALLWMVRRDQAEKALEAIERKQ